MFLVLGTGFGFLLSRAGASSFDFHARLFLLRDFQLMWVIGSAIVTGAIGFALLKAVRLKSLVSGFHLDFKGKPMRPALTRGAIMLGMGWGLTGSCPGTAPVMLGEGKLSVIFTIAGILLGTYLYGRYSALKIAEPEIADWVNESG